MRALVSASDVLGVVTTHLDRVHDAALRLGCTPDEAYEVTASAAGELVEDLASQPETVGDLVGGLYARCRTTAPRVRRGGPSPVDVEGSGPLAGDEETGWVAEALGDLPERRRLAVLLVDSYGLTYQQSAIALSLDSAETARTVALGRAALVLAVDDRESPSLAGHDTAIGDLGQLSDGSAPAGGRFAGLRKHVSTCATCAETLGVQTRGKAMVGALPVLPLADAERDDLLARLAQRADAVLPSAAEVEAELAGEVDTEPLVPPWVWAGALVLALLLGAGVGALFIRHGSDDATVTAPATTVATSADATVAPTAASSTAIVATTSAAPSTTARRATTTAPRTTATTARTSATATRVVASISISPGSGPSGTTITVSGRGFGAASLVTVTYTRSDGTVGSTDQTTTDASGAFTTTVTANDPASSGGLLSSSVGHPGGHTVTASGGGSRASATFDQTS